MFTGVQHNKKKDQSSFYVRRSRIINLVEIAKKSVKVLCWSIWWYSVDQRHITALYLTGDCCTRTENTYTCTSLQNTFPMWLWHTSLPSTVMSKENGHGEVLRGNKCLSRVWCFLIWACKRDNIAFKNVHLSLFSSEYDPREFSWSNGWSEGLFTSDSVTCVFFFSCFFLNSVLKEWPIYPWLQLFSH